MDMKSQHATARKTTSKTSRNRAILVVLVCGAANVWASRFVAGRAVDAERRALAAPNAIGCREWNMLGQIESEHVTEIRKRHHSGH
mgnify:CR=1 FL=1